MDYRMYDKGAPAGENVVELIAQHLSSMAQRVQMLLTTASII